MNYAPATQLIHRLIPRFNACIAGAALVAGLLTTDAQAADNLPKGAAASPSSSVAGGEAGKTPAAQAAAETGFISLFNGRDLSGWAGSGWTVEDGAMVCHGGFLTWKKQPFTNFILRFEVKLSPGANNGLNFRSRNSHWNEIQIIDETHPGYAKLHDHQAHGSIYGVVPARRGFCKPVGEWNTQEVMADGNHIKVTLNGTVVVDADVSKLDLEKCLDGTAHPWLRDPSGDLGWLGHANAEEKEGPVYLRNIRIKTLP